ncbi:LuxR C-terminal-related transcriptional regulator [Steroidobacter cummioxidans]|uniref:LuxR C-terminal-related transcriptional regulator n=1 Tax=Steroidobacter cummioxidans TaxID=1803913 RepID=UPI000E3133B0|nr:LuxR C-terminal-related transcriptional regulator [Steroidobacter cummioxidans]
MRTARNRDMAQIVGLASNSAKFGPPRSTSALIPRSPLAARIDRGGKVVLLLAPPGSGKTSLLTQWHGQLGPERRVAWLLGERRDREPVHFFSWLAASIDKALHTSAAPFVGAGACTHCSAEHITDALGDQLASLDQPLAVVIDDLQWLDCAEGERALLQLMLQSSPKVRWILATRRVPRFDLQRLKLEDALTLLDAADLAFQPEQICELSLLLRGVPLSLQDATECARRTEGWIAGVKLTLLASTRGERVEGLDHDIGAYLMAEAWQDLPDRLREFLLVTCVPERFCSELAVALLGEDDASQCLDELEHSQRFVRALDGTHRWFRYHTMYREFLLGQLKKLGSARIAQLHRISSQWFADHEQPREALHHAFAAADRQWALQVLARCVPVWLRTGEFPEVLQWSGRLTLGEIMSCEAVRDAHLMSLIFLRQFERARQELRLADQLARDESERRALPPLQLMLEIMTDARVQFVVPDVEALSIPENPYLTANLFNVAAYQLLVDKAFDAARRLALRGKQLLQGTQHIYALAQASVVLMLIDRAEGHAKEAAESCMQLYACTRGGRRNPIWVTATTAAASVHYHHNRLQQAEALCAEVLPLLSMAPSLENLTVAHVVAARLKCASAKYGDALRLLDYAHSVLDSSNCQRLLARVCFEKVRLWLLQEQPMRALRALADCGQSFHVDANNRAEPPWEEFALSRVAILIHRGLFDAAANELQRLCERAEAAGDVYGRVRLEATLATCSWQAHEEEAAFGWMNRALKLTGHRGFSRAVFDDVFGLPKMFATAIKMSRVATLPSAEYFKRFRDVLAFDPYEHHPPAEPMPLLTQRELDLLKLVSQGLSNKDISERSNITLLTTKWHLKNVFAKLGVSTRMEAVFRAQELRLVDGRPPSLSAR